MTSSAKVFLEKNEVSGQTKIAIEVTKIQENLENKTIKIPIPVVSQSNQNSNSPQTKFKDLKRITHVITIEGKIYNQNTWVKNTGELNDETKRQLITATQAKNALIYYILYTYGNLNLYWRGTSSSTADPSDTLSSLMDSTDTDRVVTVVFDKIEFSEIPAQRAEKIYSISDGYDYDETNTESYDVTITLTKGVTF
ncbi:MAG TPA: hypothetical protein VMX55_04125 [candidate division Zixibacteria bacterium]|nr:hypothetical protein [candidate division Zixibacteria bacterium]